MHTHLLCTGQICRTRAGLMLFFASQTVRPEVSEDVFEGLLRGTSVANPDMKLIRPSGS